MKCNQIISLSIKSCLNSTPTCLISSSNRSAEYKCHYDTWRNYNEKERGGQRKFRKLFIGDDNEEEDDILDVEEESEPRKTKSWKRIRSAQFLEIFQDMYGDITDEHPDRERFKPKSVRLTGATVGYVEALRRMQKMGLFADIPADVVLTNGKRSTRYVHFQSQRR